jgi:hypothetical protein
MKYNLTDRQKSLARFLVEQVRSGNLEESFDVQIESPLRLGFFDGKNYQVLETEFDSRVGDFDVLREVGLITKNEYACTLRGMIYQAVDTSFSDDAQLSNVVSTLAHAAPPEIIISLDKLKRRFPDMHKLGFLIMRFDAIKPYHRIVDTIKQTGQKLGVEIVRADEHEFHADLWGNVRTFLHGCSFGIAVYERIKSEEPNANVGLEVGYLMAMGKPVLLLKDESLETIQTDLAGKLYKPFNVHDPQTSHRQCQMRGKP